MHHMNIDSYSKMQYSIAKNETKTTLYLIPLLNVLIEYCKPYKEIIVKLDVIPSNKKTTLFIYYHTMELFQN